MPCHTLTLSPLGCVLHCSLALNCQGYAPHCPLSLPCLSCALSGLLALDPTHTGRVLNASPPACTKEGGSAVEAGQRGEVGYCWGRFDPHRVGVTVEGGGEGGVWRGWQWGDNEMG
ncbi:hypothetical protein V8E53_004187 [Lactarius tabidus]